LGTGERAALVGLCAALVGLSSCNLLDGEPGQGGAAQAGAQRSSLQRVRGKVNAVYSSSVLVEDEAGRWYRVQIGPETAVRRDGQRTSLLELQEGAHVEAQCVRDHGELRAIELRVSPPTR
jgi:hypothetical protein